MAVGIPTEGEAEYGRFVGSPSLAELERFFFLDDADRRLVAKRRGDSNRVGFAVQLGTVRFLGTFLADPTDVPTEVVDYVAEQVGATDASCLKGYLARRATRFEHAAEIAAACGYGDFAEAETELVRWLDDRAWTTGDGPTALFGGAVRWLRDRQVLLPGVSRLTRLVSRVRKAATERLWDVLAAMVTPEQARRLELLLVVPDGAQFSDLERLRKGPTTDSGKAMVAALDRLAEVSALGFGALSLDGVPQRRVVELARWGMAGKAAALRRHPRARRLATLLATVVYLEAKATDDALELFDVLMVNDLMARAQRQSRAERVRQFPRVARDAARCAAAVAVLLDAEDGAVSLAAVWEAIDAVVPRSDLRAAVANIGELTPPPDADLGGEWRAGLVERYAVVRRFLPRLCATIDFGATAEAVPVLDALRQLPGLVEAKATKRVPSGYLDVNMVALEVVPTGWWRQLVLPADRPEGTVHRAAYVFCVLEQFHQRLRRRDIFATASSRWADPRARLLTGPAWEAARGPVLNALQLPTDPAELLDGHAHALDDAWRHVASRVGHTGGVTVDDEGRVHAGSLDAVPDPPSLTDLRRRCEAMLPQADIGELILEVMSWQPRFIGAGTRPPALLGRDELIDHFGTTVRRALAGQPGKSVMPIGLRGVGKTVLLNLFTEIAEAEGLAVGFIEAPETGDFRLLLVNRLRKILLAYDNQRKTAKVLKALRILKTFTLQLPDGAKIALDVDALAGSADSGNLAEDVTDLLVAAGEAARERGSGILLAVDEVQYLSGTELAALITGIHRTTQQDLPVVLVGAGLPQLPGLAGDAKSYAERLFEFPRIGPLEPDDAHAAIVVPTQARGVDFSDGAVEAIIDRAHGYPYFLQEWGYHIWNAAASSPVQRTLVDEVTPRVVKHLDDNFFLVRFDRLTPAEKKYLQAMAELGPGPHRSGDIASQLGVRVESVAPRRSGLISKGMVYSPAHGDTAFTVPLFDDFLRRQMP